LNYGDDDLEGIDELNGDGQAAVAVRDDLSREGFVLDYGRRVVDGHDHRKCYVVHSDELLTGISEWPAMLLHG